MVPEFRDMPGLKLSLGQEGTYLVEHMVLCTEKPSLSPWSPPTGVEGASGVVWQSAGVPDHMFFSLLVSVSYPF